MTPSKRGSLISHIEINVSDYAKSLRFYDLILLGLGWRRLVCQRTHTTYTDGFSKLIFCPTDPKHIDPRFHRRKTGLNHLALYASSPEEVDRFYKEILCAQQIPCLYSGKPSGDKNYYAVFFEDPDRIKLEVVSAPSYCEPEDWSNQLQDDFDPYAQLRPD